MEDLSAVAPLSEGLVLVRSGGCGKPELDGDGYVGLALRGVGIGVFEARCSRTMVSSEDRCRVEGKVGGRLQHVFPSEEGRVGLIAK